MIPVFDLSKFSSSPQRLSVNQDNLSSILFEETIKPTPPFLYAVVIDGRDWWDEVNGNSYHSFSAKLMFYPEQEPITIVREMSYGRFHDFWETNLIENMRKIGIFYTRINGIESFFLLGDDFSPDPTSVFNWPDGIQILRDKSRVFVKKVKYKSKLHKL
jgi:hypothetical protein